MWRLPLVLARESWSVDVAGAGAEVVSTAKFSEQEEESSSEEKEDEKRIKRGTRREGEFGGGMRMLKMMRAGLQARRR